MIEFDNVAQHYRRTAITHIEACRDHHNILTISNSISLTLGSAFSTVHPCPLSRCAAALQEKDSPIPLRIYLFYSNQLCEVPNQTLISIADLDPVVLCHLSGGQLFIYSVLIAHVCLSFFVPETQGPPMPLACCCLRLTVLCVVCWSQRC